MAEGHRMADRFNAYPSYHPDSGSLLLQRWIGAVGGKWALPILDCLTVRPHRYNQLLGALEPISAKVLTQTLRRLQADGLVSAVRVGQLGRRYELTDDGRQVHQGLEPLRSAALAAASDGPQPPRLSLPARAA
jgi:DNA-binding HxlR family transcriptional regulator